jgi:hypothetical protein
MTVAMPSRLLEETLAATSSSGDRASSGTSDHCAGRSGAVTIDVTAASAKTTRSGPSIASTTASAPIEIARAT